MWRGLLRSKEWYGEKGRSVTRNSTKLEPVWLFRLHISSRLMLARASCWTRMTFSASCRTTVTWRLGSTAWWPWCPLTSWPRTSPVLRPYWRGIRWDFLWGYFPFPDPPLTYFMYFFLKFKTNCILIFMHSILYTTNMWLNVLLCSFSSSLFSDLGMIMYRIDRNKSVYFNHPSQGSSTNS